MSLLTQCINHYKQENHINPQERIKLPFTINLPWMKPSMRVIKLQISPIKDDINLLTPNSPFNDSFIDKEIVLENITNKENTSIDLVFSNEIHADCNNIDIKIQNISSEIRYPSNL